MTEGKIGPEQIDREELIQLAAVDPTFFAHTFFPKAIRQTTPPFLREVDEILDSNHRLISLQMFRGSSKTTRLRVYGARRIAFGLAHTVLWVGKSQEHAIHSLKWLRKQIEHNRFFTETFQLKQGGKWQDVECEIIHGIDDYPITCLALGVTGSVRGVNIDDYRPDLIILDDILDEENTATPLQRKKTEDLVYGALLASLAPKSEAPDAKMVMLQTPHNIEDVSMQTLKDPAWVSKRYGCWTPETENNPVSQQDSIWEERFPTKERRKDKEDYLRRNQLSVFTREYECRIISAETSSFKREWLNYYDQAPDDMYVVMAIDPVPPPSERELEKGLRGKDYEAIVVLGRLRGNYYLLDYTLKHGHEPNWTVSEFFRLALKYRPKRVVVESVAYQRTLAWLLRKAMEHQRIYFPIVEFTDKRKKFSRILDALAGVASAGKFHIKPHMTDFIQQFSEYPNVAHDDLLDATATALSEIQNQGLDVESFDEILKREKEELPKLKYARGAP